MLLFVFQLCEINIMMKMDVILLRSKFRGTLLGALVGDCLGSPYENDDALSSGAKLVLQKSFDKLEGPPFRAPVMQFTDDAAMTKSLAQSLIERQGLDVVDLAKKFVKSYYYEPKRGYGASVVTVFEKLRGSKFADVMKPASEQFNGQGSMGNGGAMRVAPIALFCHNNYKQLIDLTKEATKLTHTHKYGIDGAILQAIAVQQTIQLDSNQSFDSTKFLDELIEKMDAIEENDEEFLDLNECQTQPYKTQLNVIKNLLEKYEGRNDKPHSEEVIKLLGNNITALHSVPTAIFCFLRARNSIEGITTNNPMRRAIQYAITLGGDTDTIASMTGAIAGAYYSEEKISQALLKHCEASDEFQILADKLFDVVTSK